MALELFLNMSIYIYFVSFFDIFNPYKVDHFLFTLPREYLTLIIDVNGLQIFIWLQHTAAPFSVH